MENDFWRSETVTRLDEDEIVEMGWVVLTLFTWDIINDGVRRGRSRCKNFWQNYKYGHKYRRECYGVELKQNGYAERQQSGVSGWNGQCKEVFAV